MPAPLRLLIDTDPGVDDALAILMALTHPCAEVLALSIVAGNVGIAHTTANALKLLEVAGRADIPVHPGCAQPLVHPAADAAFVHGRDGFGDTAYLPAALAPSQEPAAAALVRLARSHAGELTLVALGPLTNLAVACHLDAAFPERIGRLVVMGGASTGRGNTDTIAAEFNVGFDPEAAQVVFSRFPKFELVDWEAVLRHGFGHDAFARWLDADTARARFYSAISRRTRDWARSSRGEKAWHSADALAMAVALEPDGVTQAHERWVGVETGGRLSRGATVVDWDRRSGRPANARILAQYDPARFEALIRAALGG
ncbi:MAG TPA: nucleoside hydrolase [Xanthomonadaceae bacterium]|nr:nucleoside hydrolase [Xanthomonadaceae bacterium]